MAKLCEICGKREGRYQHTFIEDITMCDECRDEEQKEIELDIKQAEEMGL